MSVTNGTTVIIDEAISAILAYYSTLEAPINRADIVSKNRNPYVVKVRGVVMYYLKAEMDLSYVHIGSVLERDHSTVMSAVRTISDKIAAEDFDDVVGYVRDRMARVRRERREALLASVAS